LKFWSLLNFDVFALSIVFLKDVGLKSCSPKLSVEYRRWVFLGERCSGGRAREEELKKKGWRRQFTTDEPRLSEAVELYRSLGFEVHLEPATFDVENEICKVCVQSNCGRYKTIYIRPKSRKKAVA
jgi:hypothetical protein